MTYLEQARAQLEVLAASGRPFTADDLHEAVKHPDASHSANGRNNLIGSVFREAHHAGVIEPVGVVPSRQAHRKGGMIRVWRGRNGHPPDKVRTSPEGAGQGSLL